MPDILLDLDLLQPDLTELETTPADQQEPAGVWRGEDPADLRIAEDPPDLSWLDESGDLLSDVGRGGDAIPGTPALSPWILAAGAIVTAGALWYWSRK